MPPHCPFCASARRVTSCPLAADLADEERMEFVTSHIAPGDLNARADLISFWSQAVAHACEQAPGLSFDPSDVAETLLGWSGATAPGLDLAIQDMLASGALVQRSKIEVGVFCACVLGSGAVAVALAMAKHSIRQNYRS